MENQHRKIKGYRELSQEEIDMMNEIKELGAQAESLFEKLETYFGNQEHSADRKGDGDEMQRLALAQPQRWLASGKTDFQTSLMKMTRSVAQPTFF